MVHDARALAPALGGRGVKRDPAAASLAAQLEPILVADAASAHQLLEHLRRGGGVRAVGADALEAAQRELGGNLGVHGDQRRVVGGVGDQLVREALGVGEPQAGLIALERDPLRAEPAGPEAQRLVGRDAVDDAMHHPGAGAPGLRARVLEERQVSAGPRVLVSVEQVVDGRVVLVDRLGGQPQAEDAGVEVDVAAGVAGDRGDVVDAFEFHGAAFLGAAARRYQSCCVHNYSGQSALQRAVSRGWDAKRPIYRRFTSNVQLDDARVVIGPQTGRRDRYATATPSAPAGARSPPPRRGCARRAWRGCGRRARWRSSR